MAPGPFFVPSCPLPAALCLLWPGPSPDTALLSALSFLSSVSQPRLLSPFLLLAPPPCPVWAPTHPPLPEAPGQPLAQGGTTARRSPCCRPSSATRHSGCMHWRPSTSSARPQVSRGHPVQGHRLPAQPCCPPASRGVGLQEPWRVSRRPGHRVPSSSPEGQAAGCEGCRVPSIAAWSCPALTFTAKQPLRMAKPLPMKLHL